VDSLGDALAAGIQPVVASGNTAFFNGSFDDGIADPACVPAAVSVGAVYDASFGGLTWGNPPFQCTDSSSAPDQVTCFSQTAPILSLLAPGAVVTAGGTVRAGTSQAAPHVTGAWAIARAIGVQRNNTLKLLQDIGEPIVDSRPSGGRETKRLDLPEPGSCSMLMAGALAVGCFARRRSRVSG